MSARKLIYRSMVCAPACFLIGFGVHARSINTDYDFLANDPRTEKLVLAYIPYLHVSASFLPTMSAPSIQDAREAARAWIDGAQKGELKPLPPVAFEDTSTDGAKAQIFETSSRIVGRLLREVSKSIRARDYEAAASDAVLAIRLADVPKYSDLDSLFNCATEQRRALLLLEPIAAKLNAGQRAAISDEVPCIEGNRETIERMINRSNSLFVAWRKRRGFRPLSAEDTRLLREVPVACSTGNIESSRRLQRRELASRDGQVPDYCSSLRLGIYAQDRLDQALHSMRVLLQTKKAPR